MNDDLVISPHDPRVIIAGIQQFGLASDGSDLKDLRSAFANMASHIEALTAEKHRLVVERDSLHKTGARMVQDIARLSAQLEEAAEIIRRLQAFEWEVGPKLKRDVEKFLSRLNPAPEGEKK